MDPLKFLLTKKSVALLTHVSPDWDTYGSSLALRSILRERGVLCDIIMEEPLSFHLNFLDTDVLIYDENEDYEYDCVCAVDVSTKERLGKRAAVFDKAPSTACIDHHLSEERYSPVSLVDPSAGATAEIIYDLLLENSIPLTKEAAGYLYCALASDTGSFRFSNTTPHSAELLRAILETGADTASLANKLYYRDTLPQMRLRAAAINAIELFCGDKVAICSVTREMIENSGASHDDASALSAIPRSIWTVEVSAVIREEEGNKVKISFRSKDKANVEAVAAVFGGGGHLKAAGATIEGTIDEAKAKILPFLEKAVADI